MFSLKTNYRFHIQGLHKIDSSCRDAIEAKYGIKTNMLVAFFAPTLSGIKSVSEHPFLYYLRLGIPVSLSTDDEGIFESDFNQECTLAVRQTDMNYAELKQMVLNSIETSFASKQDKKVLRKHLQEDLAAFEQNWALKIKSSY